MTHNCFEQLPAWVWAIWFAATSANPISANTTLGNQILANATLVNASLTKPILAIGHFV